MFKNEIKRLAYLDVAYLDVAYLDEKELAYLACLEDARHLITQMVEVATLDGIRTWLESHPDAWVERVKKVNEDEDEDEDEDEWEW